METNQSSFVETSKEQNTSMTQDQMLLEILDNSRKTKNYMKWQLYITIALVVLPLLAMLLIIPMVVSSISNLSGVSGLIQ
ncbi:MAG: hypothetical protein JNN11_01155 [Candidatus Doudnabacteria bacterium]|nr:hypothetical protein [Candidatus Doudnabacteria bacterium]